MNITKTIISFSLSAALTASGAVTACAAGFDVDAISLVNAGGNTGSETAPATLMTPDMIFTGTAVKLSLEETIRIMQTTGTGAQTAQINQKAAHAIAEGYDEGYESVSGLIKSANLSQQMIDLSDLNSQKKQIALSRDYAKVQGPADYQAEMNKLQSNAASAYYSLLLAQENMNIAIDNLKSAEHTLSLTQKKLSLGIIAKKDLLSAETTVTSAKNDVSSAAMAVKSAKMNLNFMLGHPLMQEIELTDTLVETSGPSISLSESIASALENRSEIRATQYVLDLQQIALDNLKYRYPEYSATYQKQYVALLRAEKAAKDAYIAIEMEIRNSYMDIESKKNAIDTAKSALSNAKEMHRLSNISYDAGAATLDEVQKSQSVIYQTALGLSKAINDYNLSVYALDFATGAGTERMMQ